MNVRPRAARGTGARLREDILTAAERLLEATASADDVSIRAVADAVGVTPPSIYRHFPDKTNLMFAVCLRSFDRFAEVMEAATGSGDPVEDLRSLGRAYVQYGIEHPEHYRIMFMGRYELDDQHVMDQMLNDTSCFGILLANVRALLAADVLRPELAGSGEVHVGFLLWSAVHGVTSLLVAKPSLPWPDRERLFDDLMEMVVKGILA